MLSPVFHIDVVAYLLERIKIADAETAREELSLVFVGVAPCFCQCVSIVLRGVVDFLDMVSQVASSCVALPGTFGDVMFVEMRLIRIRSATEVTFCACFGEPDWTSGHALVFSLMLSHMSLVSVTCSDLLRIFAYVTPVEMVTSLRRRRGSLISGRGLRVGGGTAQGAREGALNSSAAESRGGVKGRGRGTSRRRERRLGSR